MALCFLTKIYSIKKSCKVYYYIVDHRLRKNSSNEAQSVKKLLKKYNIKSDILKWYGKKPNSNIQAVKGTDRPNKNPIIRLILYILHFLGLSKKSIIP